jgi:hypothetical protein
MPELSSRQRRILARLIAEYIEQANLSRRPGWLTTRPWACRPRRCATSSPGSRSTDWCVSLTRRPAVFPTDSGYRLYVDGLLGARKAPRLLPDVEARLRRRARWVTCSKAPRRNSRARRIRLDSRSRPRQDERLQHIDFVGSTARACSSSWCRPADRSRTR